MLGAEPKKVNPKTMAMFDSILQQMVRHGGPADGSAGAGAKPASRERADSDKDRARPKGDKSTSGDGGPGSLRGKAVPVLPIAVAAGSASPAAAAGDASGEVATVSAAELLKSPRRRPPPSPSTPTVAPDAVHVQFSDPDPATGNRYDNPPARTCLPVMNMHFCTYIYIYILNS
jgi:hypothetical protein